VTFSFDPQYGMVNQRRAALQMQLLLDLAAMHVHGPGADVKLSRDFSRGFAPADELENLELPVCEFLER
jgi:hypothetical protein